MLEIVNLKKQLGNFIMEMNLTLPGDHVTGILGGSGSGKTTLINMISGLISPDEGVIKFNGRVLADKQNKVSVPPEQRHMGYIFQDARLFPHYKVRSNLTYSKSKATQKEIGTIVDLLNLGHLLNRYPSTLSGGEKQRVAIGRALLSHPELLLMDEPLASLDIPRKKELLNYLQRLSNEIKIPILYVSHSLEEVKVLAKNVIVLCEGKLATMKAVNDVDIDLIFKLTKELT